MSGEVTIRIRRQPSGRYEVSYSDPHTHVYQFQMKPDARQADKYADRLYRDFRSNGFGAKIIRR